LNLFLSRNQRNYILQNLTPRQRTYLEEKMKRGKRTVFSNELIKGKGTYTSSDQELEEEILEWEFIDLLDGGEGNRPYKCECGMSLRFQYIVRNFKTGEIKKFGRNHFEFHTGIPANIVKDIIKGFEQIDYELDEILYKVDNGWNSSVVTKAIDYKIEIPTDIKEHIHLQLPLLDKQVNRLNRLIREIEEEKRLKEQEKLREEQRIKEQERLRILTEQRFRYNKRTTYTPPPKSQPQAVSDSLEPEKRAIVKKFTVRPVISSPMGDAAHRFIIDYIEQNGTVSVLELCRELNVIPHNFKGFYSTGKPKSFFYVSTIMEGLVKQGTIKVDKADLNDRWYSIL
jgi:hypothetical protein